MASQLIKWQGFISQRRQTNQITQFSKLKKKGQNQLMWVCVKSVVKHSYTSCINGNYISIS